MESKNPINSYEPCQVRKEAAISSDVMWKFTFHREVRKVNKISYYFFSKRGEKSGIYSSI